MRLREKLDKLYFKQKGGLLNISSGIENLPGAPPRWNTKKLDTATKISSIIGTIAGQFVPV